MVVTPTPGHNQAATNDLTSPLVLSIDLGTTSIKIALVDSETRKPLKTAAEVTNADTTSDIGPDGCEQDPSQILQVLHKCLSVFDKELLARVVCLAVTGQMHGVMLWRSEETVKKEVVSFAVASATASMSEPDSPGAASVHVAAATATATTTTRTTTPEGETSNLITWRDQRCNTKFLHALPPPDSHLRLATGHGCATLFWMSKERPNLLKKYDCAGTIMDYLVSLLCGLEKPVMTPQTAASWGYFNTENKSWNTSILKKSEFPVNLLPHVKDVGSEAGNLKTDWLCIPQGIPVLVGLGDLQCAIMSTIRDEKDAVLNISTSTQLAFPISQQGFIPPATSPNHAIEYFPYFGNTYIATVASLTGGSVMANFVQTLGEWLTEFGIQIPDDQIWDRLILLANQVPTTDLVIAPTLQGERHKPDQRGSVLGLNMNNMGLGKIFRALCHGLVSNLHDMMPNTYLEDHGIQRIIASGSGVTKNPIVQQEVKKLYKTPIVYGDRCDSALGAALCAINFLLQSNSAMNTS